MHDEIWYGSVVNPPPGAEDARQASRANKRTSMLQQPRESSQADSRRTEQSAAKTTRPKLSDGPPKATIARRAKSYSDFYHVVKALLKKDAEQASKQRGSKLAAHTDLEFQQWYSGLDDELLDARHQEYRLHHEEVIACRDRLDNFLAGITSAVNVLSSVSSTFTAVHNQTSAFGVQSNKMIAEQQRISQLSDDLDENLRFYEYLDPVSRKLNAPGAGRLVADKEFSEMLANLDGCLKYLDAHPGHRESQAYRSRYRLLMTRALTLVRAHVISSLRDITSDVSKRIANGQLNNTTLSALLYAKFRVNAPDLKRIGLEIQKRTSRTPDTKDDARTEYQNLMTELRQNFAATRSKLILPLMKSKLNAMALAPSTTKDLVAFARSSISYVRSMCLDECDLWREWFEGEDGRHDFLKSVCEPLYDQLRPRIVKETQLLKLCELCTLIQTRYTHDLDEDPEPADPDQVEFSVLIQPALEETQRRLLFRARAMVRDEIENYRPKPEDLDSYISRGKQPPRVQEGGRQENTRRQQSPSRPEAPVVADVDEDFGNRDSEYEQNAGKKEHWYPTLNKAIWLLSRIYRLLNPAVFDNLAHHIVHQTTLSLHQAAARVTERASATDGRLFLLKHLLALKSQIVAFDFEYVTPQMSNVSNVTSTFWELRERGGLFDLGNLWRLVGGGLLPRIVENMLDAKVELDGRLRTVINDLTNSFATRALGPLAEPGLEKRGFNAAAAVQATRSAAEKVAPELRQKLEGYLTDVRIRETLVEAVFEQMMQKYERFYEAYKKSRQMNGKAISGKGKGREDDVWDPESFSEWAEKVFEIGEGRLQGVNGDDEDEEDSSGVSRAGSV